MSTQAFGDGFRDLDPGVVLPDAHSDVLYKEGRLRFSPGSSRQGGLEAHLIEPDGSLTRMGWTNLCLGSTMGGVTPLVTARGFLFASGHLTGGFSTVCSYQGLRLKPLAALDFEASVADAFVPSSEIEPALLAMDVAVPTGGVTRHDLRLFSMNGQGDLDLLDSEALPDPLVQLQFHPSRRFLFAADKASGLRSYVVGPDGRLELKMSAEHAGGSMAVTGQDARVNDR
jgi:hypothetical protein